MREHFQAIENDVRHPGYYLRILAAVAADDRKDLVLAHWPAQDGFKRIADVFCSEY